MEFESVLNGPLAEELQVIDAIYGEGTVRVISTDAVRTSIEVR
jgi:hypothetical protein